MVEISGGGDSAGREPRPNVIMVTPGPGKEPNTPEVPNSDVQVSRGSVSSMFNQHQSKVGTGSTHSTQLSGSIHQVTHSTHLTSKFNQHQSKAGTGSIQHSQPTQHT